MIIVAREEICEVLKDFGREFISSNKINQIKLASEGLSLLEEMLNFSKINVVREEYNLSERQRDIIKRLKEIFKEGYFYDVELDKRKDKSLLCDIYWNIHDFFCDCYNVDANIYETELNAIYPFIVLFEKHLQNIIDSNQEKDLDELKEFVLKIDSSAMIHPSHPGYKSSVTEINIEKYYDEYYNCKYKQDIVIDGKHKKISKNKINMIEKIIMRHLFRLTECSVKESYSYSDDMYGEGGGRGSIKINIGKLNLYINTAILDKKIRFVCNSFKSEIYNIINS